MVLASAGVVGDFADDVVAALQAFPSLAAAAAFSVDGEEEICERDPVHCRVRAFWGGNWGALGALFGGAFVGRRRYACGTQCAAGCGKVLGVAALLGGVGDALSLGRRFCWSGLVPWCRPRRAAPDPF